MPLIKAMKDMAVDPKESKSYPSPEVVGMPASDKPTYPYGLCITLCDDEIEKLDLDASDVDVGDMLSFDAMAKVTSASKHDTEGGSNTRIELQITHIGFDEDDIEE